MNSRSQFHQIRLVLFLLLMAFLILYLTLNLDYPILLQLILVSFLLSIIWSALALRFEKKHPRIELDKDDKVLDLDRRRFLRYSAIGIVTVLALTVLPNIEIPSENLLYNGDFNLGTEGWNLPQPNIFTWKVNHLKSLAGLPSLEVQTDQTYSYSLLWSWISSTLVKVDYGATYRIVTHIAGDNVLQSSVIIQPYGVNKEQLNYQLAQVPSGINGTFPFTEYEATLTIPYDVQYLGLYLLAGLANESGNPGKTYFAGLSVKKVSKLIS